MTRLQAQRRNFLKYRLKGIHLDTKTKCLTEDEINRFELIKSLVCILLTNWDNNSLLFVEEDSSALKRFKCYCGQRTNIDRKVEGENVCKRHYLLHLEETQRFKQIEDEKRISNNIKKTV